MFHKTRLKLTAWYLLILAIICLAFSITIYRFLSIEIDRFARVQRTRIERRFTDQLPDDVIKRFPPIDFSDPDIVSESKARIIFFLLSVNGVILLVCGSLSYFLSGITLKPIKQMVDEQDRFLSDASHELRTPLASMKTATEVALRDKNLKFSDSKKILKENLTDINRLSILSNSLLELSRFQKKANLLQTKSVKIKSLILEAVNNLKVLSKSKNIKIIHKSGNTVIDADPNKVIELLTMVIDNAVKYSPPKTTIKISTSKSRQFVHFYISDQGQGIAPKDQPFIFDRFYRSDIARSSGSSEGFGLGLSIAKEICSLHNGTISVTSEVGHGSTFDIKLPLKQKFS